MEWLDVIGPLGTEPGPSIGDGTEPGPMAEGAENGEPEPGNELGRRDVSGYMFSLYDGSGSFSTKINFVVSVWLSPLSENPPETEEPLPEKEFPLENASFSEFTAVAQSLEPKFASQEELPLPLPVAQLLPPELLVPIKPVK